LLFLGLAAAITASIDTIYQSQLAFYLTFGPLAALLGGASRLFLADNFKGGKRAFSYWALLLFAFETGSVFLFTFSAVFNQSQLLGKKFSVSNGPQSYDLFHGNWHVLLSLTVVALYRRIDQVADELSNRVDIEIDRIPWLDAAGIVLFDCYSVASVVLKEGGVEIATAQAVLGVLASVLFAYSVVVLASMLRRWSNDRDDTLKA